MSLRWIKILSSAVAIAAVLLMAPSAYASGSWSTSVDIDGSNGLTGVSCVLSSWCVAVDKEGDLYRSGGLWSAPTAIGPYSLNGVSCVSSSFCAAVDDNGNGLIYRGGSWSSTHVDTDASTTLYAVSCGSTTLCMAVDGDGNVFRYNGTSWAASLFTADGDPYEGVSCILNGFCLAVSDHGYRTYTGTWSPKGQIGGGGAHGVSCISSSFCVATDTSGNAYTYSGSTWSAPTFIDGSPLWIWFCRVRAPASVWLRTSTATR